MKTTKTNVLGVEVEIEIPSTVEEYDSLAGRTGAALDGANRQTLAHKWAGEARDAVVEALEEKTKIEQRVIKTIPPEKEGGKETKIYETAATYVEFIKKQANIAPEDFATIVKDAAGDVAFNPGASTRTGTTKKEYFNMADTVLTAGQSGNPTPSGLVGKQVFDKVTKTLEASNPGLSITRADDELGTPDRDSLAAAYRANDERVKREAHSALAL